MLYPLLGARNRLSQVRPPPSPLRVSYPDHNSFLLPKINLSLTFILCFFRVLSLNSIPRYYGLILPIKNFFIYFVIQGSYIPFFFPQNLSFVGPDPVISQSLDFKKKIDHSPFGAF